MYIALTLEDRPRNLILFVEDSRDWYVWIGQLIVAEYKYLSFKGRQTMSLTRKTDFLTR